jgi:predicted PurR-regulated permease PerM
MSPKTIQLSFFAVVTAGIFILLFFILKPFLGVIFLSVIFAIVFYPLYEKLTDKFNGRKNLAAFAMTCLIFIFVIVPVIILSTFLLKEAVDLYNSITLGAGSQNFISQVNLIIQKISSLFPSGAIGSHASLESYAQGTLNWIIGNFNSIFVTVFGSILNFILMLISMHYLFIFGDKIKKGIIAWSPLPDKYDEEFIKTLKSSINAVLHGRILASVIQGTFLGIGFAIFGIGSPVLWGFVGGIASLIPILGASIITVPAVIFLFLSHSVPAAVGLLLWGAIAVGLIENVVSAIFLKDKIKIHPLIVLFSIFGGVAMFGPIGFLVGPVVVSAVIALMKIYPFIMSNKNEPVSSQVN